MKKCILLLVFFISFSCDTDDEVSEIIENNFLLEVVDPSIHGSRLIYDYDNLNRLTSIQTGLTPNTSFVFSYNDMQLESIEYYREFDGITRVIEVITYTDSNFHGINTLNTANGPSSHEVKYTFEGKLIKSKELIGLEGSDFLTLFFHDNEGRVTKIEYYRNNELSVVDTIMQWDSNEIPMTFKALERNLEPQFDWFPQHYTSTKNVIEYTSEIFNISALYNVVLTYEYDQNGNTSRVIKTVDGGGITDNTLEYIEAN